MAVKELLDSAIDAAELDYPTTVPHVRLAVDAGKATYDPDGADTVEITLMVTDNGPGLPVGVVDKVLDFSAPVLGQSDLPHPDERPAGQRLEGGRGGGDGARREARRH